MATTLDDDFDMPDLTDEMIMEFKPLTELAHTDLHMGAAVVKPFSPPKKQSVDLFGIMANAVIGAGYLGAAWLFVQAWIWVLFN
jgi:hypothetical protein